MTARGHTRNYTILTDAILLFLAGQRPIIAGKLAYYADAEFRGLFDQIEQP